MTQQDTTLFAAGGYRYVPGVFQYSAGVVAAPGFDLVRVRFRDSLPLAEGFARIEAFLKQERRPLASFCACELRSPAPFDEEGFRGFNRLYVETLKRWGITDGETNPVARTNVCPLIDPPPEPAFHAFTFTVERPAERPGFVVAGSGESAEGKANYRDHTVRLGDLSPDGMREKARYVLGEMERRLTRLGVSWKETSAVQAYTIHDLHPFLADEIVRRGAARSGLTWHYTRPPVVDLEFEMDCRGVALEMLA
ncbi:MAG: 2-amino-5-chloromuconate deaminase CnbZ [Pseudomonadota bacterium]